MSKTFLDRTNEISGELLDAELPSRWLAGPIVVNRDLSIGIGWEVNFPYLTAIAEDTKVDLHNSLRAALNLMPQNIDVQIIFDQDHDGKKVIEAITAKLPKGQIAAAMVEEKARLIEKGFKNLTLRRPRVYIILVRKNHLHASVFSDRANKIHEAGAGGKKPGLFSRLKRKIITSLDDAERYYQFEAAEWELAVDDLSAAADAIEGELTGMRLSPRLMQSDDIVEMFYRIWNPGSYDRGGRPRKFDQDQHMPITDYFLCDSVKWSTNGAILIDGYYHRIMTVRIPPSPMTFTQWDDMLMHSSPTHLTCCRMVVNIQHDSVEKRVEFLKTHRLPQVRAAAMKDPTKEAQYQEILDELRMLGEDREKIWRASHVIHLWAKTEEELDSACERVRGYGEKKQGVIISKEAEAAWRYWIFSQPFWTRDMDRYRDNIYNTSQLVTQLPTLGIPNGMDIYRPGPEKDIGAVFETNCGTVFNFFPSNDQVFSNNNGIIIGGSGSGKTFLLNTIIAEMGRHNPISIIVDLGGSYRSMCEAQGGHYIDLDLKKKENCMNPLALPPGEAPDPDHVESILTFVEKLCIDKAKDTQGVLPVEQKVLLSRALNQLILKKDGKEFFLSDLRDILSSAYATTGGDKLALRLEQWCKGRGGMPTRYGNLFDGETRIDMSNPFIVFDLQSVKDNAELSAIFFSTIIRHVSMLGQRYPGRIKLLAFDECWTFLEDPALARFIVTAFRALRKAGFATIGISQGVSEFMGTSNKSAIIGNLAHKIILRVGPSEVQLLQDELGLTQEQGALVGQLKSVPGQYSQALIVQQMSTDLKRACLIVNRPSPIGYWCSTTNPKDKEIIARYKSEYKQPLMETLVRLSKEYPRGFSAGAVRP